MNNNSTKQKNFKIGHLNARSLSTGFDHFSNLVLENNFDILCVSETWLNANIPTHIINIPGFNFVRKDRNGRGGGIGVYVKNEIKYTSVFANFCTIDGIEYMCTEIKTGNSNLLLCTIYRTPGNNCNVFIEFLDDFLSYVAPQYENILLLGDINVDHSFDNPVSECMLSYDFTQVISEPTRITQTSQKILDVIYFNNTDLLSRSGTLNADLISDHRMIFCEINLAVQKSRPKIITYRNFSNFRLEDFLKDLNNIQWDNIFYLRNIDLKLDFLTENILSLFNKHSPFVTSRITKPYSPWLTDTIRQMMKERDKALSQYKKDKTIENWNYYKQLRNFTLQSIRREKSAYLTYYQNRLDSKHLWKALQKLNIKQNHTTDIPHNLKNENDINAYFTSVYSPPDNCPGTVNQYLSNKFNDEISFNFQLATVHEINEIIHNLKSNAYGSDNINAYMLQLCSPVICKHITHIINSCLELGYFPNSWKLTIISPLPKISTPKAYSDLRPICIITALSKILEKFIQPQIYKYATSNNIISQLQSGFRKGHSTVSVLANITDDILKSLDDGYASLLVLLDFSKAFDTLDHTLLCAKLSYFGFNENCIKFFRSYLCDRYQTVKLNDTFSNITKITSGVFQGSALGPILFLIYTADIFSSVNYTKIQCYADDTQLSYSFDPNNIKNASDNINHDLTSIERYSNSHNLKLNIGKCAVICFCNKKNINFVKENIKLKISDISLTVVNKVKSLGLIYDENLRFKEHVNLIVKKAYIALKLLYNNINIINFKLRKKLCESLVLPILHYCNVVYYSCLDKLTQNRLQKIQNSCCRFVYRIRKYHRTSSKINELGWLRVENIYKYNMSVFTHRILCTSSPPYLRKKLIFRNNIHDLNLRHANKLSLPLYRLTLFRRSFSYNSVIIYNDINDVLKCLTVDNFRKKVKIKFFSLQ